jgi:LuxR family quorum sensing-dependent transcriptional regulator
MDLGAFADILDAVERIDRATSPEGIVDELCTCLQRHGFSACLVTRLPVAHDKSWHRHILLNGWPDGWYERYRSQGHYRHDPCAERSRTTADPFFWSELDSQSLSEPATIVMREAAAFGLREGVCIPIHSPFAPPAAVSVAGEIVDLPPATIHIVSALARHAFRALVWSIDTAGPGTPVLSEREREILQWTAAGKTAWEISRILAISLHTANTHLKNARYKLGAANATHSVVEALRRREIQL